jgi:hypothetical protein
MLGRLRARLTYANVASSIALFVALGTGGAYAANTIGSSDIIDESILSQDIKNGEVKNADIGADAMTSTKLANGSVQNSDLGPDAVTTSKIKAGNVGTTDLADNAVTAGKIPTDAVGADEISSGAVGASELGPVHEHFGSQATVTDTTAHDGSYAIGQASVACGVGEQLLGAEVNWVGVQPHNERNLSQITINRTADPQEATVEVSYDGGDTVATYQPVATCLN